MQPAPSTPLRLTGIEGLRGVAALGVLTTHLLLSFETQFGDGAVPPLLDGVMRFGSRGVDLFFVLSGFLLALPFADRMLRGAPLPSIRRYLVSRVARIVPGYWVALTFFFVLTRSYYKGPLPAFLDYSYMQNYFREAQSSGLSVAWTLGVEVQYYLALPLLALGGAWLCRGLVTWNERALALALALAVLVGVATGVTFVYVGVATWAGVDALWANYVSGYLLSTWVPKFAAGMLLAVLYLTLRGRDAMGRVPRGPLYALTLILCVVAAAAPAAGSLGEWAGQWAATLWPAALLAAVAFGRSNAPVFTSRPLHWLGLVSYGIYLYHNPLIEKIGTSGRWFGPSLPWLFVDLLIAAAVTLTFAAASYYLVERPVMAFRDARFAPRRIVAVTVPAAEEAAAGPSGFGSG